MVRKSNATVSRSARTGKFTVHKDGGSVSVHMAGKKTPRVVSASIRRNRDALKRLANR